MIYKITVQDQNKKPIPGALVAFLQGNNTLLTLQTDATGVTSIDDTQDGGLLDQSINILVSKPGYSNAGTRADKLDPDSYFVLNSGPGIPVWMWLLLGGVGLYAAIKKR